MILGGELGTLTSIAEPDHQTMKGTECPSFKKNAPAVVETTKKVIIFLKTESKLRSRRASGKVYPVRFYGKNYPLWAQQMELFLKQLCVAYVLYEPCPSLMVGPEATTEDIAQSKVAVQKWMANDSLCRRTILNHLSFSLCYTCLKQKKTTTAKELWEDLKILSGTHATKRSLVRQYMEFLMLEKKPIVEQVQELNRIFDSMVASGVLVDEKFHTDVIISKLPESWRDVRIKLMHEKYMTITMLMDRLRVEEESRMEALFTSYCSTNISLK